MNIILNIYHILYIIIGISSAVGLFFKFYVSSITYRLKSNWQEEISNTKTNLENKHDREISKLYDTVKDECSSERIKSKVKDFIQGEIRVMEQDIRQIKELAHDLKQILGAQQETLIAIQMSVTELKPRIANLEERVHKLESKS